jgi:hypothetical protein
MNEPACPLEWIPSLTTMKIDVGMVGRFMGEEWSPTSVVNDTYIRDSGSNHLTGMIGRPLLGQVGWAPHHIMVTDLQTGEGRSSAPAGWRVTTWTSTNSGSACCSRTS